MVDPLPRREARRYKMTGVDSIERERERYLIWMNVGENEIYGWRKGNVGRWKRGVFIGILATTALDAAVFRALTQRSLAA